MTALVAAVWLLVDYLGACWASYDRTTVKVR
jgi:hypothetical protein